MPHYPLDHHLRQPYRFLAFLAGAYLLVAGVAGLVATWGEPFFDRGHHWSLGLRVNPASAWLIAILGLVIVGATLIGGNVHHHVTLVLGWGMCGLAVLIMATLQTDANVLHASMTNVLALLILGLITLTAGLFGKVGDTGTTRTRQTAA